MTIFILSQRAIYRLFSYARFSLSSTMYFEEWSHFIEFVNSEKLVFLDESGVNTDFSSNYGRSIDKSRVVDHIPRNTPKNTTVVSSIRLNGEHAYYQNYPDYKVYGGHQGYYSAVYLLGHVYKVTKKRK